MESRLGSDVTGEDPSNANPTHVIAVGASAGGVEALAGLVSRLPADMTATVLVVMHLAPHTPSVLPRILSRHSALPVTAARDGHRLSPGEIVVAVPDHHLVVNDSVVRVVQGPEESGHRPAIDVLFRSVARWWGRRAVGVVLTGALDDGSDGLMAISDNGGLALVQDPHEAAVAAMPEHALLAVPAAEALPVRDIGFRLANLRDPAVDPGDVPDELVAETDLTEEGLGAPWTSIAGPPVPITCPTCNGPMFEANGDLRFRCRTGHAWTAPALVRRHATEIERALEIASRIIEDDIDLQERLMKRADETGRSHVRRRIDRRIGERKRSLAVLHDQLRRLAGEGVDDA